MANRNKAKGTGWESAVADYLNEQLGQYRELWKEGERAVRWKDPTDRDNVRRNVQEGVADIGDLGVRPFAGECKAEKSYDLAAYVRQAEAEATNAGQPFGVAYVKRPRAKTEDGYAVTSIRTHAAIVRALREAGF
ncbi:hypothetical protein [Kitasatospora sp. MBT66]|uniref:hypothetical protein n=1 Tax=Kitasatospora sp. MBT66 TaxID=1444769 RepID=UPI00068FE2E8|nr:hypothetical protein [Kitasatospora sp. MBT66]